MSGVQLLIVNREDRNKICKVGEVGEIYVRAAGLAEGVGTVLSMVLFGIGPEEAHHERALSVLLSPAYLDNAP